jgi:hypothetical protein
MTFGNRKNKVQLPIGVSNFQELIENVDSEGNHFSFVDKSLFIKEIINDLAKVKLITRPRRFGKTLNMSMLHHFFAAEVDGKPTVDLFKNLKINQYPAAMKYQGQYPVIFMTFKGIDGDSFEKAYDRICSVLRDLYKQHQRILLDSDQLSGCDKESYQRVLNMTAPDIDIRDGLKNLTTYLYQHYGVQVKVFIDEYDAPIQNAYLRKYYNDMIDFMRDFLSAGLKDNHALDNCLLTGILRVSKESLFSGLNHVKVYSLLHQKYGEYFGFTEPEIIELLDKVDLKDALADVKEWYNGYQAGSTVLYNPWSIINFIKEQGVLDAYWVNTSSNDLIKDQILKSDIDFQEAFEQLLQGNAITGLIIEDFAFNDLDSGLSAIWTLFLMAGYIKAISHKNVNLGTECQLAIPNQEVRNLYQRFIFEWLSGSNNAIKFNNFLQNLLNGKIEDFAIHLQNMMWIMFSSHDIKGRHPEKFFHGFMLGLLAGVDPKDYAIDSNKEAGLGRYDILIAPRKDNTRPGIIIEIKSLKDKTATPDILQSMAEQALEQIDRKKYKHAILLQPNQPLLNIGICFNGKELSIASTRTII